MGVDKQRNNAVRIAGRDRRSQPPVGPSRLICGKGSPARPKGGIGTLRRHGHLGLLHPQQNEASMKRNKRMNTNPVKGPFHHRSPADMVMRVIRGMLPHKHYRGSAAFQRIKCVEGIPEPFASLKRVVVPDAFRVTRLRPGRKFSSLGKLAVDLGWGYQDVLTEYEEKRKGKAAAYYAKSKAKKVAIAKAKAANQ